MPTATKSRSKSVPKSAPKSAPKSVSKPISKPLRGARASKSAGLGALPEWNLADLYPAIDSPELKRDLARAEAECVAFEEVYKGKLAAIAAGPDGGQALGTAVKRYETIEDLLGRIGSFAGLTYAGDTVDPVRAKFFGDMQERITAASLHLLFFTLELNRLDDAALERAMADPALGHYRPWIEDERRERLTSSKTASRSCSTRSR